MKVKRLREDFVVAEVSEFSMSGGKHSVYRLEKQGIGTPEAVQEIHKIWNLPSQRISYGGLKDRHAITSQTVTIVDGPASNMEQPGFTLTFLGRSPRPFTAQDIVANQFDITLRGLSGSAADSIQLAWQAAELAIPNYFDEQRFGSLGESGQFVAHAWCLQNYERALFLAIAEANPHDRPQDREQKRILRERWGDWETCKSELERSHRRSVVTYLVDHPAGFKKALALVRRDLRSIYAGAFQAFLWNELVSRKLSALLPPDSLTSAWNNVSRNAAIGPWVFPTRIAQPLADELRNCRIPLPSGRKTAWKTEDRQLLEQILSELGMQLHQLRFSYPRDVFFSRGLRDMQLDPQRLSCRLADDDLAPPGIKKVQLEFRLKPGQYATMLIKGLEQQCEPSE
jgi:tRNA pseudouridine13 synthase